MPILKQTQQANTLTLLSTELNSLANNTNTATGTARTNTQGTADLDGYTRGVVELVLAAYTGTPTAGTGVSVWFLRAADGTNYEDGGSSVTPARRPDVVIPVRAVASGPQRVAVDCWVPVGTWRPMARNEGTGISFAASGNTVRLRMLTDEGV